jgi:DNA-binding beta-propeller fold protein YncE
MQYGGRCAVGCVVGCLAGVLVWAALAGSSGGVAGAGAAGLSADPGQEGALALKSTSLDSLIVPGVQVASNEAQQVAEAQQTRRESPAAVAARAASRTRFEHLGAARAAQVARVAFPEAIDRSAGGPPRLPAGQRIIRYVSPHAAQLELPGGRHAVVESMQPMAVETSQGHDAPVDLALTKAGGSYESVRPAVGVLIPQRLSVGVDLLEAGVSLTPVDPHGSPLGGSDGRVDGASVLYPNAETDTDVAVKPTASGVETNTILRSLASPQQLYFRVGLPSGASLVQAGDGHGPARVVQGGRTIAIVLSPSATDAAGVPVPVSMGVKGDLLALAVASHGGAYQWPIAVDPELALVKDTTIGPSECHKAGEPERVSSNWCVATSPVNTETTKYFHTDWYSTAVEMWNEGSTINAGNYTTALYHTQGKSRIYEAEAWTAGNVPRGVAKLELAREVGNEEGSLEVPLVELAKHAGWNTGAPGTKLCSNSECSSSAGTAGNVVAFKLEANEPASETYGLDGVIEDTKIYIAQENPPELSLNTSEANLKEDAGRENVAYGSGSWLGPNSGAFEMIAKDPGIGVSSAGAQDLSGSYNLQVPIYEEGKCNGVQCNETYHTAITYAPGMSEGENKFELWARDKAELFGQIGFYGNEAMIKVDATPPEKLEVTGWSTNREISAAPHTLTLAATDGAPKEGHSSGVKSIGMSVDGGPESRVPIVPCTPGPCTASGKWTLDAEGLTEGVHRLVETATDNAGNVAPEEFTFDVRHAAPVPVGPGKVDPTTGELKLSPTDVSLAGAGGVSRVYESRNLTGGVGGPLGPQWALSLGGGEGLVVQPDGSVVLASSAGMTTTFTLNKSGELESPPGDSNVKLEAKEKAKGKGITEYLLVDAKQGTTTTFTQPHGTENTVPLYTNEFGGEGVQLKQPEGAATDAGGNAWVTDTSNGRVVKFSAAGTLIGAYGSKGTWQDQFESPYGIAVNQSNGNVYVSDEGNHRIVELNSSGQFVQTFGWGVTNGHSEFEICKESCRLGLPGAEPGQLNLPKGLAVDSSGNVWVVDAGNNRVVEFKGNGEYAKVEFGTAGSGEGQFKNPMGIALSGGNLYVSEEENDRVQELSTAGAYLGQWGKAGSGNNKEFNNPRGIATDPATGNLYVTDTGNHRVQEFSPSGTLITKFGTVGSGAGQFSEPKGIAVGSAGGVYITDSSNNNVEEWTRPTWLPTSSEGPLKTTLAAYAYKPVEEEGTTVIDPTEVVAPAPSGVTCTKPEETTVGEALVKGCRALLLTYAVKTKSAIGENPSEWGEYTGRLKTVTFKGYNPAKGAEKMEEKAVAEYAYDSKGRLRAEWDPRIETTTDCGATCSALKTTYGYDAEGHLTALTRPGHQPWAFSYGTIAGDPNNGRLLKATQAFPKAGASESEVKAKLKEQKEAPTNSALPKLSGTPAVGNTMGVSSGTWTHAPVVYSYQWKDCNDSGGACTPILGATNANYTVATSDAGDTLVATVTATNGGGSVVSTTAASKVAGETATEYSLPTGSFPEKIVLGPDGNLWYTDSGTSKIGKITTSGSHTEYPLTGAAEPQGITPGPAGSETLWYADYGTGKIGEITTGGSIVAEYPVLTGSHPGEIALGPDGNVWYANQTSVGNGRLGKITTSGAFTEYGENLGLGLIGHFTTGPENALWFADYSAQSIDKATTGGEIANKYSLELNHSPFGLTTGSEGNLWFTDYSQSEIGKITPSGAITEYKIPTESRPDEIVQGYNGNYWYTDSGTNKIGEITTGGSYTQYAIPSGSVPRGITKGPNGDVWYAAEDTNKIGKIPSWGTASPTEGTKYSPEPGWTIEYRVPVAGGVTGLSNLSAGEVSKWGQKDDPTEAMAVFPPDKPQGWPASTYERATIDYMDEQGREVNGASPGGGIGTTEFNEFNEVTRTLSPDNRAAAVKEGCKAEKECLSAEVAEKLDTKTEYNSEDSQLIKVVGPEHKVKLTSGSEVQARLVTHDYYSQSTKEVEEKKEAEEKNKETYNLMTRTTSAALLSNGEEKDKREGISSFSGQNDLGWKLRKPTSVTREPNGADVTTTTVYDGETGNTIEVQSPAAAGKDAKVPPSNVLQFGSKGTETENGKFKEPRGMALAKNGNLFVVDTGNNRVEEFTQAGKYETKFGSVGALSGQMKSPYALAVDPSGNVWVTDNVNNRLDEFTEKGVWVKALGFGVLNGESKLQTCTTSCKVGLAGSGPGQFKEPRGIGIGGGDVYVADGANNRVEKFTEAGAFVSAFGYGVNETGEATKFEICTTKCKAGTAGSGPGQFKAARGLTVAPTGFVWVADSGNNRIQGYSGEGKYELEFGSLGTGPGQFKEPKGIGVTPGGTLLVGDGVNNRVQELTSSGTFITSFGEKGKNNGQFEEAWGIAATSTGNLYVVDLGNNRVEKWVPAVSGNEAAHDSRKIYYTNAANSEYAGCGGHPEWANLVCKTVVKSQAGTTAPELPESTVAAYDMWDQAEKTEEKFGAGAEQVTRTETETYDAAGRAVSSEETATPVTGTVVPPVTDRYNAESGALEVQSATIGGKEKALTSKIDTLGDLVEYSDAEGNVAKYTYEEGGDGRLKEATEGKGKEAESTASYVYNVTTGLAEKVIDTAVGMTAAEGTFTATYDVEGHLTGEVYPNGMCVNKTFNSVGSATGIEYLEPKTCSAGKTVWFKDTAVPSIFGEALEQTSTLAKEKYSYDNVGRLLETQETPAGKGCTVRVYAYDEEGDRTSLTTRESGTETCPTEGGSTEWHTYDTAGRLTDSSVQYDTFGNIKKMPAADAGGHEIVSSYYVDNQLASEEQGKGLDKYVYDPVGRAMEMASENLETKAKATIITHYAGSSGPPTWTSEGSEKWTRSIVGIDGALDAILEAGKSPVLQLHDLAGNIVGTVGDSESETKLSSTYNSTEFGVPQQGTPPPKYAWLGATGVSTEPSQGSGASVASGGSYVPQVAQSLQTAAVVPPGAFPNGQGTGEEYGSEIPGWFISLSDAESAATLAEYTATQEMTKKEEEEAEQAVLVVVDPEKEYLLNAHGLRSFATKLEDKLEEYEAESVTIDHESKKDGDWEWQDATMLDEMVEFYKNGGLLTKWGAYFRKVAGNLERNGQIPGHKEGVYLVIETFHEVGVKILGVPLGPQWNFPMNFSSTYCGWKFQSKGYTYFYCGSKGWRALKGLYN